jgi:signal transduction histidine kinase
VYRIAQEAINNVLRHADARTVWLDVTRDIGHVEMRISDDGSGICRRPHGGGGLGLSSISERAAILGATIELQPNVPSGTILFLRIPVHQ